MYRSFPRDILEKPRLLAEGSEPYEEMRPFWKRNWSEISLDMFDAYPSVFSFVEEENIAALLGCHMHHSLNSGRYLTLAFERALFVPKRDGSVLRHHGFGRLVDALREGQRLILADYLQHWSNVDEDDCGFLANDAIGLLRIRMGGKQA